MGAKALRMDPAAALETIEADRRSQDSRVNLKAPVPPQTQEEPAIDAPADFVEFMSEERGIAPGDAFDLLCRLVAEYRTPVRREIDVLKLSA